MTDSIPAETPYSGKPLRVLVTGITGNQGSHVASQLLARGHRLRALVRDPDGPMVREWRSKGVEPVVGDFESRSTLESAAHGVDAMFLMSTMGREGSGEAAQGIAAVDAAKAAGVPWLVYSSVACADRKTGIPHFETKFLVEEHLRRSGVPFAIDAPTAFMENFVSPYSLPGLREGRLGGGTSPDRGVQMVALDNLGALVRHLIEAPSKFRGRRIEVASDEVSQGQAARIISELSGRTIEYQRIPLEALRARSADTAKMLEWFERERYTADIDGLRREFPQIGWQRFPEWAARQDWRRLLS
jgi:uncharacterized protein YbjT (DUF2867 family)